MRADKPGMDAHDPKFLQIADLGQKGEYEKAAGAVEPILADKIYDIRLLVFYFFQIFMEDGPARMGELLETITALAGKNLAALGPAERKELHLNKSLMWLFQVILDAMEYHRVKNDAVWTRWMASSAADTFADAAARAQALDGVLSAPAFQKTGELLARVSRWMRDLRDSFAAARAQEVNEASSSPKSQLPAPAQAAAGREPKVEEAGLNPAGRIYELRGSPQFVELCNKLRAFEVLVEKQEFAKAAMVGDDILHIVEDFDPRKFFPELFARFGELIHEHVAEIKPHWQQKDSVDWRMAEQFYRVDLETFVRGGK